MLRRANLLIVILALGFVIAIPTVAGDLADPTTSEATESVVIEEMPFTPMSGHVPGVISVEGLREINSYGICDEELFCPPGCEYCLELFGKITCGVCP